MASRMLESSDDESDFEGFSEIGSDIDVPIVSDDESDDSSSDGSDSEDETTSNWSSNFTNLRFDDFVEQHGTKLPAGFDAETARAIDYFWLMMKPDLFVNFARHTNNYARYKMEASRTTDTYWTDTTAEEMRAYVGINILMGIQSLPEADMYWSGDNYIGNSGVQGTMTCNRFQKLTQYFHVADRAAEPAHGQPGYDKLYKVRPVMEHVTQSFAESYILSREVAIDEAMVRYTGRLSIRQYMPAKPIKRGIKIWMLCDSNTAYLNRFSVYLGRQTNNTEYGLGHNVVMNLTSNIRQSHRHVYFDNFFTGVPLMTSLLANGLYACGTVRCNRKEFPDELKKPRDVKNRGESKVLQRGPLVATVWKDKKLVHHLSTLSDAATIVPCTRRVEAHRIPLQQPQSCQQYNQYMGGVDLHDQYRMKYEVGRNSKKWWKYLFWFLVNCAIVNAFILYKLSSRRLTKKKRYSHLDFRLEVIRDIIGGYTKRKRPTREMDNVGLVDGENIQGHVHGRLPGKKRTCKYHTKTLNVRRETVYGCTTCNVHLCKNDVCHAKFHQ